MVHVYAQGDDGKFYHYAGPVEGADLTAACEAIQHDGDGRVYSIEPTNRGVCIAYKDSTFYQENPPYILEGGVQMDLTREQGKELEAQHIVYLCEEDCCYHIYDEFMAKHGYDADKAMDAIQRLLDGNLSDAEVVQQIFEGMQRCSVDIGSTFDVSDMIAQRFVKILEGIAEK